MEDEQSLKIMYDTSKYIANERRWEAGLFWKYENGKLPESRMVKDLDIETSSLGYCCKSELSIAE